MLVQVRAVPKHRSTHISNYQSTERESYEHDETSLTIIPMCPRECFSHYKKLSRLILCYKKDWATLLHLIYFYFFLLVTICRITKLFITYNFSACREYLAENHLSFPSTPNWVRHSYLLKGLWYIPYTCWSSVIINPHTLMAVRIRGHERSFFSKKKNLLHLPSFANCLQQTNCQVLKQ